MSLAKCHKADMSQQTGLHGHSQLCANPVRQLMAGERDRRSLTSDLPPQSRRTESLSSMWLFWSKMYQLGMGRWLSVRKSPIRGRSSQMPEWKTQKMGNKYCDRIMILFFFNLGQGGSEHLWKVHASLIVVWFFIEFFSACPHCSSSMTSFFIFEPKWNYSYLLWEPGVVC